MPYAHQIHFTLQEARAILPEVVVSLTRMRDLKRELDARGYDIRGHHYFVGMGSNGTQHYPEQVDALIEVYRQVDTLGIQIKDLNQGLIDFPAIRPNGEEVYLCYMLGEDDIGYWHQIRDGLAGRQPIDTF